MLTKVSVEFDQAALQTVEMALVALKTQADVCIGDLKAQVKAAIEADNQPPPPPP